MNVDFLLEVVMVPVSDVDRAKEFYAKFGFAVDHDVTPKEGMRVVQLTPPGSACSIVIGTGMSDMTPGSINGLHLVVEDIAAAQAELVERGIPISEVRLLGPEDSNGSKFAFFSDPDGNGWEVQEIKRA
jgi:catechol 2,3-dioxygenase-like lactoylglutathione lyase family enzyme